MTDQQQYPYQDGDVTVLGPRVFVSNDGKVISWRGVNYVPHPDQGFTVPDEPQTASVGYCPACGRGDVAPTPEEYEQQRQRAEQAEAKVTDYENRITWHTTCSSCARILDSSIRETDRLTAELADYDQRVEQLTAVLARVQALADEYPVAIDTARIHEALDTTTPAGSETTTRFIALYEQWVKAGPPPLGTSLARWWDARLVELHDAIRPPADQPKEK